VEKTLKERRISNKEKYGKKAKIETEEGYDVMLNKGRRGNSRLN